MKNFLRKKPRLKPGDRVIFTSSNSSSFFYSGIIIGPKHRGKYPIKSSNYGIGVYDPKNIWLDQEPIIIEINNERKVILND